MGHTRTHCGACCVHWATNSGGLIETHTRSSQTPAFGNPKAVPTPPVLVLDPPSSSDFSTSATRPHKALPAKTKTANRVATWTHNRSQQSTANMASQWRGISRRFAASRGGTHEGFITHSMVLSDQKPLGWAHTSFPVALRS